MNVKVPNRCAGSEHRLRSRANTSTSRVVRDERLPGRGRHGLPVVAPSFCAPIPSGSVACSEPMPIFEYECTRCGRRVEEIQKFGDPPPALDDPCTGLRRARLRREVESLAMAPFVHQRGSEGTIEVDDPDVVVIELRV